MENKGMPVAYCIGGRRGDNDHGPSDTEDDGTSPRPELLRAWTSMPRYLRWRPTTCVSRCKLLSAR
jgi:hypothetical protein